MVPGFFRNLAASVYTDPQMSVAHIRKKLHYLGWEGFDLDYHTLQLGIACLEAEGFNHLENKPADWFEKTFKSAAC
jgi:hypothetical protein